MEDTTSITSLLFWMLQAVWGLCMGLLFLWLKNMQAKHDTHDERINAISGKVYSGTEGIENLKEAMRRVEAKIDRFIERQGVR